MSSTVLEAVRRHLRSSLQRQRKTAEYVEHVSAQPTVEEIQCLFCDSDFVPGRRGEDIIPDWYGKAIGRPNDVVVALRTIAPDGTTTGDRLRVSQTIAATEFRLPDVCPDCNNGPLSAIERTSKETLLGLMDGQGRVLAPEDQRLIAAWAQLKAITYDATQTSPVLPRSLGKRLLASGPIREFGVMLGKYDSRSPLEVSLIRHHSTLSMNGTQQPVWVSRTTLIFGNLILSAAIVVDGWLPVEFLVHRDVAEAVDIWPPKIGDERRSVSWPPAELITASTLPRFV